jgi:hypothetical protein
MMQDEKEEMAFRHKMELELKRAREKNREISGRSADSADIPNIHVKPGDRVEFKVEEYSKLTIPQRFGVQIKAYDPKKEMGSGKMVFVTPNGRKGSTYKFRMYTWLKYRPEYQKLYEADWRKAEEICRVLNKRVALSKKKK